MIDSDYRVCGWMDGWLLLLELVFSVGRREPLAPLLCTTRCEEEEDTPCVCTRVCVRACVKKEFCKAIILYRSVWLQTQRAGHASPRKCVSDPVCVCVWIAPEEFV